MRDSRPLPPLPILPGTRALHPREETGERGGFREVQAFSYLTDGERGLQQEVGSLHRAMSLRFNPRPHRGATRCPFFVAGWYGCGFNPRPLQLCLETIGINLAENCAASSAT